MITIVLADDEKLIRAGLRKILLENLEIPVEIIEAKNGEEALQLCREKNPAILITDIRMPVMDGVELMRQISLLEEKPAIVVLSGYDDFSYAKAAIQSGAISYILKPVDKKELISTVNSAIMDSIKEEKEQNELKMRRILEKGRLEGSDKLPEITVKNGLRCITIYGNNPLSELEKVMANKRYYVLEQTRTSVCLVFPFDGIDVMYEPSLLETYIVGISGPADDYSMLRLLRRQAVTAAMQAFFVAGDAGTAGDSAGKVSDAGGKRGGLYYYEAENHVSDFQQIEESYEKMISRCDIAEAAEVQKDVNALFSNFDGSARENSEKLYYLYRKITEDMFTRFPGYSDSDMYLHLKGIMLERLFEFQNLEEWKNSVCDYTVYLAALLKRDTKESPYIAEAIAYIKTHFTKNINMAMVANQVSVNYTWFSEKFKEHTGVNFNEYLKRMRLEEAKRLLQKDCYKVYEVAERCGFSDVKYFMKQFREETGMSPTEWSSKHKS